VGVVTGGEGRVGDKILRIEGLQEEVQLLSQGLTFGGEGVFILSPARWLLFDLTDERLDGLT